MFSTTENRPCLRAQNCDWTSICEQCWRQYLATPGCMSTWRLSQRNCSGRPQSEHATLVEQANSIRSYLAQGVFVTPPGCVRCQPYISCVLLPAASTLRPRTVAMYPALKRRLAWTRTDSISFCSVMHQLALREPPATFSVGMLSNCGGLQACAVREREGTSPWAPAVPRDLCEAACFHRH